jgi:micrococcal nuclease
MSLRRTILLLLAVALVGSGAGSGQLGRGSAASPDPEPGETFTARVTRVVDGDTVKIRRDGSRDTVRLIGIDTPESVKPDTPVECFAKEASRETKRLLDKERVRLVLDREARDRYGRLLAYAYRLRDNRFVNARLLAGGYARTLEIRPNTRFAARFRAIEADARRAGRGLWAKC